MAPPDSTDQHVYILRGRTPRQKHVFVFGTELSSTEEAELWTGEPAIKIPAVVRAQDCLREDQAVMLQGKLEVISGVTHSYRTTWTFVVNALEDLALPGIYSDLAKAVAEVMKISRERVHVHDLTNDSEMNIYIVGQSNSTVRYLAVSHRPLTASEVDDLLNRHQFEPEASLNGDQLAERNEEVIDDIWLQPGIEEAENEDTFILVTSTTPDAWNDDLKARIAQALAVHASITMQEVKIHDLTIAA